MCFIIYQWWIWQDFFLNKGTKQNFPTVFILFWDKFKLFTTLLFKSRLLQVAPQWQIKSAMKKKLLLNYKRIKKNQYIFFWGGGEDKSPLSPSLFGTCW